MLQNASFFKTLLNGIKSKFQSQQKQISKNNTRLDEQQAQIDELESKMSDNLYVIQITEKDDGTYESDKELDDIVAAVESGAVLIALYEPKRSYVGKITTQYTLYLDEFTSKDFSYGDGYYIKLTAVSDIFNSFKKSVEQGNLGFDIVVNYAFAGQRDIKKTVRYNIDIIYRIIEVDGEYHLYLNENEVQPNAIAISNGKNCYIDYGTYRYFNVSYANETTPTFYNLSNNGISSIVINRRNNTIDIENYVPYYTLPIATSTKLGGVQPVAKTDAMSQDVGVDENGKLYTAPGVSGNQFVVKITDGTDGAYVADKTFDEIIEAIESKQYTEVLASFYNYAFVLSRYDLEQVPNFVEFVDVFGPSYFSSDFAEVVTTTISIYKNNEVEFFPDSINVTLPTKSPISGVPYFDINKGWDMKEQHGVFIITYSISPLDEYLFSKTANEIKAAYYDGNLLLLSDSQGFVYYFLQWHNTDNNGSWRIDFQKFDNPRYLSHLSFDAASNKLDLTFDVSAIWDKALLPSVTTSDNGKFLRVVNGAWAAAEIQNANGEEF